MDYYKEIGRLLDQVEVVISKTTKGDWVLCKGREGRLWHSPRVSTDQFSVLVSHGQCSEEAEANSLFAVISKRMIPTSMNIIREFASELKSNCVCPEKPCFGCKGLSVIHSDLSTCLNPVLKENS